MRKSRAKALIKKVSVSDAVLRQTYLFCIRLQDSLYSIESQM